MSLQVWLPLNGDLQNKGLSNINVTNNGATINDNGKIGKCYQFGTNKYLKLIDYASEFLTYDTFSLSVWFKCTAQNTAHPGSALISGGNWNASSNLLNLALGYFSSDHYTKILISGSGLWSNGYSYNFYLNTWYNIVLTSGNGAMRVYVNGELIGDTYAAFTPATLEQSWICIGNGTYTQAFHFIGLMNDIRIYDHALSIKQIKEISKGLVLHYPLDNNGLGCINLATNTTFPNSTIEGYNGAKAIQYNHSDWVSGGRFFASYGSSKLNFTEIEANQPYTISVWVYIYDDVPVSNPGGTTIFYRIYKTGDSPTYSYDIAVSLSGVTERNKWVRISNTFISQYTYTYNNGGSFQIGGYNAHFLASLPKIEKSSIATKWSPALEDMGIDASIIYDISGYQHNGTINNITYSTNTPKYQTSAEFNTTKTSYIKVDENNWMAQHATDITINLWAYMDDWSTWNGHRLYSCTESGGWNIQNTVANSLTFPVYVCTNEAQTSYTYIPTTSRVSILKTDISSGWHMFTYIYNTSGCKVYLDGILYQSIDYTSYGLHYNLTGSKLYLGCQPNGVNPSTPYFNGKQSDFRIYYTTLSVQDILELYHTSALADKNNNFYTYQYNEQYNNESSISRTNILKCYQINQNPNYLSTTYKSHNAAAYLAYQFDMLENLQAEQTYTLQLWDVDVSHSGKTQAQTGVWVYWGGGNVNLFNWAGTTYFTNGHADYLSKTFTITGAQATHATAVNAWLNIYNSVPSVSGTMNMSIGKWKLTKGGAEVLSNKIYYKKDSSLHTNNNFYEI